jgi:hypothetical protein
VPQVGSQSTKVIGNLRPEDLKSSEACSEGQSVLVNEDCFSQCSSEDISLPPTTESNCEVHFCGLDFEPDLMSHEGRV